MSEQPQGLGDSALRQRIQQARATIAGLSLPLGITRESAQHERGTALALIDEALAAEDAAAERAAGAGLDPNAPTASEELDDMSDWFPETAERLRPHTCRQGIEPCAACEAADRLAAGDLVCPHGLIGAEHCGPCCEDIGDAMRQMLMEGAPEEPADVDWLSGALFTVYGSVRVGEYVPREKWNADATKMLDWLRSHGYRLVVAEAGLGDGRIGVKDRAAIIRLLRGYAFADEGMAEEAHAMADKLDARLKEQDR